MPPLFTKAFAERLEKSLRQPVIEAAGGERVVAGGTYVAPGGKHLTLVRTDGVLRLAVTEAEDHAKHAPSIDRLFESVAAAEAEVHAVVLTGMGNDGAQGVAAVARSGGTVWAESEKTAVIAGMPQAAMKTGHVTFVLPLDELAVELAQSVR